MRINSMRMQKRKLSIKSMIGWFMLVKLIGDRRRQRGAIRLLIYAGKFEGANQLFMNTKETILVEENAKLDALYTRNHSESTS